MGFFGFTRLNSGTTTVITRRRFKKKKPAHDAKLAEKSLTATN